jgi:DNA-binding response OmpR family regulator
MRILVAEDDAPLAEFLHQRLEEEQFAVQVVSDGKEAERMVSNQQYDLVLLDLNPNAGGLDVLRGIHSKQPDLPVLIVTAATMVEERVRGLDAGADDYVVKPPRSRRPPCGRSGAGPRQPCRSARAAQHRAQSERVRPA